MTAREPSAAPEDNPDRAVVRSGRVTYPASRHAILASTGSASLVGTAKNPGQGCDHSQSRQRLRSCGLNWPPRESSCCCSEDRSDRKERPVRDVVLATAGRTNRRAEVELRQEWSRCRCAQLVGDT